MISYGVYKSIGSVITMDTASRPIGIILLGVICPVTESRLFKAVS
jgi:hypothetical protein